MDRWRGAHIRELALHPYRHYADKQQAEGYRGDRRWSNIARHARVVGTAACRQNRARPCCNSRISVGPPLNIAEEGSCRLLVLPQIMRLRQLPGVKWTRFAHVEFFAS